jgi:hypothetical protein
LPRKLVPPPLPPPPLLPSLLNSYKDFKPKWTPLSLQSFIGPQEPIDIYKACLEAVDRISPGSDPIVPFRKRLAPILQDGPT